jgi:hypothetical protein
MRPDAAIRHDISQAGPFTSKVRGDAMPKSRRYPVTELPGTRQRSCREAQQTFLRALDDAVRTHGAGDLAKLMYAWMLQPAAGYSPGASWGPS